MKFYTLDTECTFGKYKGKTIREIVELKPSYLEWCVLNLQHFYLSNKMLEEIKSIRPGFVFSEDTKEKLKEKYSTWQNERLQKDFESDIDNDHSDIDNDYLEKPTYKQYNGSYVQDVEGWSDQDINDVFDGIPEAYWNID